MSIYMGIDSSTTATKVLLMTETGAIVGVASSTYDYATPHPLWSEQQPILWWKATTKSIREVMSETGVRPAEIKGIGLTGQMHGLVLLDKQGKVLRPAILWNDQRTAAECDEIRELLGKERLISITGNDALTGFTAPKILWVKNREPEIYAQIGHILLPKDYVRFMLTGTYATDKSGGAGTQLFDLGRRGWSDEIVEQLRIEPSWLPPTYEGTEITGVLSANAAAATGLMPGIPVMAGGGDQAANAVGTGAVTDGIVTLSLGTSGVVFASADEPIIEASGRLHAFCHAVPGKWHLMGVMLSAAGSLRWYRDNIAGGVPYEALLSEAATSPAGSEGLVFLPYLTGERTPHPDPLARGAFIGLTVRHTQAHLIRSILEGVAFGLRDSFELMKSAGLATVDQVRASGGGVRSALWRQILADVLQAEIVTVKTLEGAAYGAAILAAVGAGAYPSVESACEQLVQVADDEGIAGEDIAKDDGLTTSWSPLTPGSDALIYDEIYPQYRQLYPALRPAFTQLSQLS